MLLPDDERLLAEQWLLIDRSVFEVEEIHRGAGFTLRDLRTGDFHLVRERLASAQLKPGALICARVVPAGEVMQVFGGIEPVPLHDRDELIALLDAEPSPVDLVAVLSRRFAPPVLVNMEGEQLVPCEITLRTEDPTALATELDETYRRDGSRWIDVASIDGHEVVRATMRLTDDDELRVDAENESRADQVLDVLGALDPTLAVMHEVRQPAATASPPARNTAADSVLDQYIRDYEQKWLDMPIPALAGRTPREAAEDPTRRDDLIRLIDSFPSDPGNRGVMNADRLRRALGL